ncbi:MAG: alpha-L-fucosidase C-terminal domain-containing protein [Bacteroidales bacterium]
MKFQLYKPDDIRFTSRGRSLYAFVMEKPSDVVKITSLGLKAWPEKIKVKTISLMGCDEKLKLEKKDKTLVIQLPLKLP